MHGDAGIFEEIREGGHGCTDEIFLTPSLSPDEYREGRNDKSELYDCFVKGGEEHTENKRSSPILGEVRRGLGRPGGGVMGMHGVSRLDMSIF